MTVRNEMNGKLIFLHQQTYFNGAATFFRIIDAKIQKNENRYENVI